jgi:hypothetical protein
LGVTGQKKLTLFLWENVKTSLELLAYQYRLLKPGSELFVEHEFYEVNKYG